MAERLERGGRKGAGEHSGGERRGEDAECGGAAAERVADQEDLRHRDTLADEHQHGEQAGHRADHRIGGQQGDSGEHPPVRTLRGRAAGAERASGRGQRGERRGVEQERQRGAAAEAGEQAAQCRAGQDRHRLGAFLQADRHGEPVARHQGGNERGERRARDGRTRRVQCHQREHGQRLIGEGEHRTYRRLGEPARDENGPAVVVIRQRPGDRRQHDERQRSGDEQACHRPATGTRVVQTEQQCDYRDFVAYRGNRTGAGDQVEIAYPGRRHGHPRLKISVRPVCR